MYVWWLDRKIVTLTSSQADECSELDDDAQTATLGVASNPECSTSLTSLLLISANTKTLQQYCSLAYTFEEWEVIAEYLENHQEIEMYLQAGKVPFALPSRLQGNNNGDAQKDFNRKVSSLQYLQFATS